MTKANWIDVSYFQDPEKFDYQAAKQAGIQGLIIRSGYGKTQDTAAAQHIANAQKYGFMWHLYHYWYNMGGEAEWAVQNAKSLGLTANQYLFLDMEDKSLPADWNGQFAVFRKAAGDTYKVGLYCSDSPYKAKFQDSQLQQLKVARWVASYSYEPANYDIWQMSGAGSGGFGSYTGDVDRDYTKSDILSLYATTNINPVVTKPTADLQYIQPIMLQPGYDTETNIYGLGYSPDNGVHFYVTDTVWGRKYRQEDGDRLWPFLKGFVSTQIGKATKIDWDNIEGKPDLTHYYTKDEVDKKLATAITGGQVDLSGYMTVTQADDKFATKADLKNIELTPGPAGRTGAPGKDGKDGSPGKDGKSAYEIAVDNGFVGSETDWLKSLRGSSSGTSKGDSSLSIEAISQLIEENLKAKLDVTTGDLTIDTGTVNTDSMIGAVVDKVVKSISFKLDNGNLVVEIGGANK